MLSKACYLVFIALEVAVTRADGDFFLSLFRCFVLNGSADVFAVEVYCEAAVVDNKDSRRVRGNGKLAPAVAVKYLIAVEHVCELCVAARVKADSFVVVGEVEEHKHGLVVGVTLVNELFVHDVDVLELSVFESLESQSYLAELDDVVAELIVCVGHVVEVETGTKVIVGVASALAFNGVLAAVVD